MEETFKLIMISAMYENGGNTTHRLLDGHPELFVYPFESQIGTKYVNDFLSSLYPLKYRWPVFPTDITPENAYQMIIDEEGKVRSKTPYVSKFRTADFDMKDADRMKLFSKNLKDKPANRRNYVESFFKATFDSWKNHKRSGREKAYVGYSPIIGIDGDKMIDDFGKDIMILHVVRNPFSAYADTKKRAVPLSLPHYITGWIMVQHFAKIFAEKYPKQFFIVRFEDIAENSRKTLSKILKGFGIKDSDTLSWPSWNGEKLGQVYPWGTIRIPTTKINIETAKELNAEEIAEIETRTKLYLSLFGYEKILEKIKS